MEKRNLTKITILKKNDTFCTYFLLNIVVHSESSFIKVENCLTKHVCISRAHTIFSFRNSPFTNKLPATLALNRYQLTERNITLTLV